MPERELTRLDIDEVSPEGGFLVSPARARGRDDPGAAERAVIVATNVVADG